MTRVALLSCLLLACPAALVACGGDDEDKTVTQTKTVSTPAATTAESTESIAPTSTEAESEDQLTSCPTKPPDGAGVFDVRQSGFQCEGVEDFTSQWMSTCASIPPGETCGLGEFDCVYEQSGEEVALVTCTGGENRGGRAKVVFKVGA